MRSFTSTRETTGMPIQDDLPAEVLRELQVEELWARRNVLAELMNEERLALYALRRALLRPARLKAPDAPWRDRSTKPLVTVVPIRGRKVSW